MNASFLQKKTLPTMVLNEDAELRSFQEEIARIDFLCCASCSHGLRSYDIKRSVEVSASFLRPLCGKLHTDGVIGSLARICKACHSVFYRPMMKTTLPTTWRVITLYAPKHLKHW
eukprot:TRINITY_DN10142_c0_g1_i1.p1 TRINITY_DN10142_c0_g1~~TRINITY_DN10142_c0_g1_i1.p1  ORF type:complete len:115 (+),score=5.20 TRINITY_DN10142_c0_g1_i1:793-1137(+)